MEDGEYSPVNDSEVSRSRYALVGGVVVKIVREPGMTELEQLVYDRVTQAIKDADPEYAPILARQIQHQVEQDYYKKQEKERFQKFLASISPATNPHSVEKD